MRCPHDARRRLSRKQTARPETPAWGQGPPSPSPQHQRPRVSSHHRHTAEQGLRNEGPSRDVPCLREPRGAARGAHCRPAASGREVACLLGTLQLRPRGLANFLPSCQGDNTGSFGAKITRNTGARVGSRATPASQPTGGSHFLRPKGRASSPPPLRRDALLPASLLPAGDRASGLRDLRRPWECKRHSCPALGQIISKILFSFSQVMVTTCACRAPWKERTPISEARGRHDPCGRHRPKGGTQ